MVWNFPNNRNSIFRKTETISTYLHLLFELSIYTSDEKLAKCPTCKKNYDPISCKNAGLDLKWYFWALFLSDYALSSNNLHQVPASTINFRNLFYGMGKKMQLQLLQTLLPAFVFFNNVQCFPPEKLGDIISILKG